MLRILSYKKYRAVGYVLAALLLTGTHAYADVSGGTLPSRGLQNALAIKDHVNLYGSNQSGGFAFTGGFFSGSASGLDQGPVGNSKGGVHSIHGIDPAPELVGDQRIYAMMIDGRYDFNNDQSSSFALHPYIMSGVGVAHYGANQNGLTPQTGDTMPMFRIGGGVTYQLGPKWDLSLDYKAGLSPASQQLFTGRNQQPVDLQVLNMGMHYQF